MTRLAAGTVSMLIIAAGAARGELAEWPPRDYLVRSLVEQVPAMLAAYSPETGRFGGEPWICSDQNRIFPLAAAWSIAHPDNPHYRSDDVLAAIAGGGAALTAAQDANGRWRFDKKDGSYWGQIHMPWTYSRWVRAYLLVRDALAAEVRAVWEQGLLLGYGEIARAYPGSGVHNIPVHHAMGLYLAGVAFDNEDWRQRARQFMPKAVAAQDPAGFWSENKGPVVAYNYVYSDALGIYHHFAQDAVVLDALRRAAHFHAAILWPNGSAVSCIDERNIYSAGTRIGNPGFSHTPEGRGYLMAQLRRHAGAARRTIDADMAAALLLYGGSGETIMPEDIGEDGVVILGDREALIRREETWSWALSAYTAEVPNNRWIQDRHNLADFFHRDLGLVAGGGNTKLQPYWSTFTLGDVSLLRQVPGDESPDFTPEIDLAWTPHRASVSRDGSATRLDATLAIRSRLRRETLLAEGFETVPAGTMPEGWRLFGRPEAGTLAATDTPVHAGQQSLHFVNHDNRNSLGLRTPQLPAEPDGLYFAEAWWRGEADRGAAIYLEFWDAQGQRLQDGLRILACPGQGEWVRRTVSGRAPVGAVGVTALLYSAVAATTDGHFDDVTVGRLTPEAQGGSAACSLEVRSEGEDLVLTYRAPQGAGVQAHLPLRMRGARLDFATGARIPLLDEAVSFAAAEVGEFFLHAGLRISMPPGASLRWPARQFNPYTRDGRSALGNAKIVLVMPFAETDAYTLRLRAIKPEPFAGLAFEARDLPFAHSDGTYTRRLDDLGSLFIGRTQPGDWLRFTLPEVPPGRYELIGDFVVADSYGIVEVLVDGKVVGQPFDGYWGGVDASGTLHALGDLDLGGQHEVTVRVIGKNPAATNQMISVKRWLLRPRP